MKSTQVAFCGLAAIMAVAQQAPPNPQAQGREERFRLQPSWPVVIPGVDSVYSKRCASCHGANGSGASAGSILPYVRYHTDKDLAQRIAAAHSSALQFSAEEQRSLAKDLRGMTGTNPSMATGGYI